MATAYSDKQRDEYLKLAQEVGISKAIRDLGYPAWPTAQKWVKAAGIDVSLNKIMSQAKKYHTFYETEDMLMVVEEGIERCREVYVESDSLTPEDLKKTAEATQKLANVWQVLQGKASAITENRDTTPIDVELFALLENERKRNTEEQDAV